MTRCIGTHAGCGGQVIAPTGYRYCRKCMLSSLVTSIELTAEPPACRQCHVEMADDNCGHWPALGCCADCEYLAIQRFVTDSAKAEAA